ncbi:Outer membrane protein V [Kosakonia radicincitans]|nr:Outer membrane protein V [Kosakonia radicincitans]
MRNIEPRHKFPHLLSGRMLKKMLPGAVLALLATPILAAEQKQGNELTLGGGVDVAPRYSGSDESRVTTAWCLITLWQMVSSSAPRVVSVTATTSASGITALR